MGRVYAGPLKSHGRDMVFLLRQAQFNEKQKVLSSLQKELQLLRASSDLDVNTGDSTLQEAEEQLAIAEEEASSNKYC
jgi:hypothetical protein